MLTQSYHITTMPLFLVILIYGKELNIIVKYTFFPMNYSMKACDDMRLVNNDWMMLFFERTTKCFTHSPW